jgi:hypothetical protein
MKLRELLTSTYIPVYEMNTAKKPMNPAVRRSLPNLNSYEYLNNNNHPYMAYRFGVALAGSPNDNMYPKGPIGSDLAVASYTDGDETIRKAAEKVIGVTSTKHTTSKSQELSDTNTTSPVRPPSRNKHGI